MVARNGGRKTSSERANAERLKSERRAWYAANRERIAAERKAKRDADPERARAEAKRLRERKRVSDEQRLKRNEQARLKRARDPGSARERSRKFREEHPERIREYQRRYRERHPDHARLSTQKHRDAHADEVRERQRVAAAARRRRDPDAHRRWYESDLEAHRAHAREEARLRRRLEREGLPPRRLGRLYAEERRANDAAADEYFTRSRSVPELAVIATEFDRPGLDLPAPVRILRRRLAYGPLSPAEYLQRAADSAGESFRAQRYVQALNRMKNRELTTLRADHERRLQSVQDRRPQIAEKHYGRRQAQLREEIRMDSIARENRGLVPYDLDAETRKRVDAEVVRIVNGMLAKTREESLRTVDAILDRYRPDADPAAPHRGPAAPGTSGIGLT